MSETATKERVRFSHLSYEAFVSPLDQAALASLQRLPLFPLLIRKFNEFAVDRIMYAHNSAVSVRCGPKQFPSLHALLQGACAILDVPEPELYVSYHYAQNAYTAGVKRTFIVLHSSLIESYTDDELLYILGHELGHIKCGHMLYRMMGIMILVLLQVLGEMTFGVGRSAGRALLGGFYQWSREAEISCDRAGLLVCQDPQTAFRAVMKIGCGATRFTDEVNVEAFLEQARAHSEATGLDGMGKLILFLLYKWQNSHPEVVYRAKFLDEWVTSGAFEKILSGDYERDATGATQGGPQVKCHGCGLVVSSTVAHCPRCGQSLFAKEGATAAPSVCKKCGAVLPAGVRFCMVCGSSAAPSPPPNAGESPAGPPPDEESV